MNEQLSIPGRSRAWRLDPATRRRGRTGVAEARRVLQHARAKALESRSAESPEVGRHLVADAA